MSVLTPPPAPPVPADPSAVRLVLFGMPDAGKSSLLGALAQAAHSQGRALHGHLTDLSHDLGELRNRVYDERLSETLAEIVPYPVRFAPYGKPARSAVLYDCDGRAANDLLTRKRSMEKEARTGTLAGAVLDADALILTIDASAATTQIEDDFREFLRFLRHLERYRSRQHAVGGLPVFLVLTKCDLLARDTPTRSAWQARIADRQQDVAQRFKQFLAAERVSEGGMLSFGSIHLEVRATAVRQPALADAAPQPREPYGVAELFQHAFADAMTFRDRRVRSHKRLLWTVGGAGSFLAAMAIAGAIFLLNPSRPGGPTLADRVEHLKAAEGPTAATRLGSGLDRRLQAWLEIQSHPAFPELAGNLQDDVRIRLEEGQAYVQFRDEVATTPPPASARSIAELGQIDARLRKLTPPVPYQSEWAQTEAALQRDRLLKEIAGLRDAVARLTQFYFALKNRATNLLQVTELSPEWDQQVRDLETAEKSPPFARTDPTRGPAYEFEDVTVAQADWQRSRERLLQLRDVATALGLVGAADEASAPLALRPPPADASVPELAGRRWQILKTRYPDYAKWSLANFPDAIRPELERRLRRSIDQSNRDGQRLILERLKAMNTTGKEDPADWPRIGEYLLTPPLKDWRELTVFLAKLADPGAPDPVQTTAEFLRRTSFELEVNKLRLRIPDTLSDAPVRPNGDLVLEQRKEGVAPIRVVLRQSGEPERDRQTLVYTFAATARQTLTYRPGDRFFAELPVRKGEQDLKLTWAASRTTSFQFESLLREPRLHALDQKNIDGQLAEGVVTTVTEGKFPSVPPMVPIVPFEKK
jgi:hypothetical protein